MAPTAKIADNNNTVELTRDIFNEWFKEEFTTTMAEREETRTRSIVIIATKGTIDWAYPPFILATTAAAMGWDVTIFFSFYALELLKK